MYLKRHKIPKKWPIPRKGTTYVVRPSSNLKNGIPVLIILRDMLKIVQNRKELKKAIHLKKILVNNSQILNEKHSVLLFDTIEIVPSKKYYRVDLSKNGKFEIKEINKIETTKKISKVMNKKILRGKKQQFNLSDGRNFISDIKCNINDSILINLESKKIEKCLPLNLKSKIIVFEGKHTGEKGSINKIDIKNKMIELNIDKKKINVLIRQLMVIE